MSRSAQKGFGAFVATADSYTNQSKKTSNFGTVQTLLSEKLSTAQKQTYLKFTVPAISGTVTGTALRLNVTDPTVDAPKVFATASNTWTESGLTWNNQPLASGAALADAAGVAVGTLTYSLSALAAVAGTYSYVLIPDSSNKIGVSSKEASAANRPALIVTFS